MADENKIDNSHRVHIVEKTFVVLSVVFRAIITFVFCLSRKYFFCPAAYTALLISVFTFFFSSSPTRPWRSVFDGARTPFSSLYKSLHDVASADYQPLH